MDLSKAAIDVLQERNRQVLSEGWDATHDDAHDSGDLSQAAGTYALHASLSLRGKSLDRVPSTWPWDDKWWKPTNARRDLVKAGALILAEIERLDRIKRSET